jgi:UDP-GlcNAc:undecaprenyl-phosphate/decaprenyl-phosphate GlcNAc-1-phosphate transferase
MSHTDAVYAFIAACAAAALLTPLTKWLAWRVGAVDRPRERGLSEREMPRLGGLAIFVGVVLAAIIWLPDRESTRGILIGAGIITAVGAVDDVLGLAPQWKLSGQIVAALAPVLSGVKVTDLTLPIIGPIQFHSLSGVVTMLGLVAVMNVVNFSDGIDGLAAGVCAISGVAFTIIAFDLHHSAAAILAAATAGAAAGFLIHNFYPASVIMGDSGSNLLGYLLGVVAVLGSLKTNAVVTLITPLVVLAVPFLDTGFVVAKRLKYKRAPWSADANHFHHRMARIGFSQRRTVLYLYAWTLCLAGIGVALRFVPYSDHHGHLHTGWSLFMVGLGLIGLAASVYLVYVLEILKFKGVRGRQLRRLDPDTTEWQIQQSVERDLETGEFRTVSAEDEPAPRPRRSEETDESPQVRAGA